MCADINDMVLLVVFLLLLPAASKAEKISEICKTKKSTEGNYGCRQCLESENSDLNLSSVESIQKEVFKKFLNLAGIINEKIAQKIKISEQEQGELFESLNRILDSSRIGKPIFACFSDISKKVEINRGGLIKVRIKPSRTETRFNWDLQEKRGGGEYETLETGIKSLRMNPLSLADPLTFFLIYLHEMQHGCNVDKKQIDINVMNESRNFNKCDLEVFPQRIKSKECSNFHKKAKAAFQRGIIDELRSFKLMVEMFRELVKNDRSFCTLGSPFAKGTSFQVIKEKHKGEASFWGEFDHTSSAEFWSQVEDEMDSGQFVTRVSRYYGLYGYPPEALFVDGKTDRPLRSDFIEVLRKAGWNLRK